MRNPLLSKKLKRTETRLLIIDDNQIRFNQIRDLLTDSEHQVQATLLDDLQNFEKQLNLPWDLVIFGRAYDLKYDQALSLIRLSKQPNLPLLLLKLLMLLRMMLLLLHMMLLLLLLLLQNLLLKLLLQM